MYFQSKLHNNSILTGSVDSYCLVCDTYLRSEDEAFSHTEKPIHKKNMGAAKHLEKFVDDHIIKVKKGYYCTFCNVLLFTTTKVGLHVSETNHLENRGAQMLTRVGDNIVAFGEVVISWKSWHGIMENTCVICNTEFEKEDVHKSDQLHILKLIQTKCEFGDNYVYRKVDEESFFCLICGNVFSISDKPEHHNNLKHEVLYNHGKELKKKTSTTPQVKGKKITKLAPPTLKPENGTKNNKNDPIINPVQGTDENSSAASSKKKDAGIAKLDEGTANKTVMGAADPILPLGSEKTEDTKENKVVDAKNTEEVIAKKTKVEDKVAQDSVKKPNNKTPKVDDFIDSAAKLISSNDKETEASDYLNVSNYIVQDEAGQMRCVLCDVICIKQEDLRVHLSNDLHHQMMLKKHKENLYKKKKGPNAEINEVFPADNLIVHRGKIYLDDSEDPDTCRPVIEITEVKLQPLKLEIASPSDIQLKIRQHNPDSDISSDDEEQYKTKILEKVDKYQENDITIDISAENAYCKQCNEDVSFDPAALERHITERHKNENSNGIFKKQDVNIKTQIVTYARENYMVVMQNEAYCKLCSTSMYLNMENMVDHVNLDTHKEKALSKNRTGPVKKVQSSDFIQTFFRVKNDLGSDIILNSKYVLRYHSFHCVTREGEGYKCGLCDVDFSKEGTEELNHHLNTIEHIKKLGLCNVVNSLPEELIREITPGKYHCGYCNKIFNRWPAMQDHLQHPSHSHARRHAKWNLERYNTVLWNSKSMQLGSRGHSDYNQPEVFRPPPPPPQPEQSRPSYQYFVMLQEMRASNRSPEPEEPQRPSSQGPQP